MAISGNQIRAARALIGMEQKDLASLAKVAIGTIRNMEAAGMAPVGGRTDTLNAVVDALRTAGVLIVPENGEGAGVRLRRSKSRPVMNRELLNILIDRVRRNHPDAFRQDSTVAEFQSHDGGFDLSVSGKRVGELELLDGNLVFSPEHGELPSRPDGYPTEADIAGWVRHVLAHL